MTRSPRAGSYVESSAAVAPVSWVAWVANSRRTSRRSRLEESARERFSSACNRLAWAIGRKSAPGPRPLRASGTRERLLVRPQQQGQEQVDHRHDDRGAERRPEASRLEAR